MTEPDRPDTHRFRHHGLLGTVIELQVSGSEPAAAGADAAAVAEIERLQAVFNARDPGSELSRWAADPAASAGPELAEVIELAEWWRVRTGGTFDAAAGRWFRLWAEAEATGIEPTAATLAGVAATLAEPGARRRWYDLSALAKGWIVDRAVTTAIAHTGVTGVTVNAGGDLAHTGVGSVRVGVENPHRPYDNAAPLDMVVIEDGAVATSGGARRWWRVGGRRYPQLVDPRTGRPVTAAAATVLAPDAATADALATALIVSSTAEALDLVDGLDGVAALLVGAGGEVTVSAGWPGTLEPG
ncbi:MAG: FAD:protein FMN transferase [Acidimicrobiales bacterium]